MNLLITGATGYVGSVLAHRLLGMGHRVTILIRAGSTIPELLAGHEGLAVALYEKNTASISKSMGENRPDTVIHCASLFIAEHTPDQVDDLVESNILLGAHLLEAMVEHKVTRIINTGSFWQNYNNEAYNPLSLYAATKQAFEDILRFYHERYGIDAVTLRLVNVYGPGDTRRKAVNLLIEAAHQGTELDMSPGEQVMDMVYIDDVVDAFCLAMDQLMEREVDPVFAVYSINTDEIITLKELARRVENCLGKKITINWGARPYRAREMMDHWKSVPALPQWKPKIPFDEGLCRIIKKS